MPHLHPDRKPRQQGQTGELASMEECVRQAGQIRIVPSLFKRQRKPRRQYVKLTLFCCFTVPLDSTPTILNNPDSCPKTIPECHLCSPISAMSSKSVVKLGLCLIDGYDVLVACCVKESKV